MKKFEQSSEGHFQFYEFIEVNLLILENEDFSFQMCHLISCILFGLTWNVGPILLSYSVIA